MKRRSAWLSFAACALTAAAPCRASQPARPPLSGPGVQVIAYANGQTGFFEKATGTLYLYDASLKNCVGVRRISRLGQPLDESSPEAPGAED